MKDTRMTAEPRQTREGGEQQVHAIYRHPQGKTITVYSDGTYECRDANGKKKPTSATPAKLAAGHGAWERVGP